MTASIPPADWLRFIQTEYLVSFVRDGGSAIKFAVPMEDALRGELLSGLASIADQSGYLVAGISASETKAHLIDELFFRTAEQIPWRGLCRRIIAKIAVDAGYAWIESGEGPLFRDLAERNNADPQMLLLDLKKALWSAIFKQTNLTKDFRAAITHLCIAELAGGPDGVTATKALTDWLSGRNRAVSAIKPFQIFRKINRANGRHFFESLSNCVRFAGYPGLVILLDAQRLAVARNPRDNSLFYSKAAILDAYEVLRQFIDATGQLNGCFLAVVPDAAFLEDPARGISAYEALKFRVFDEVRDKRLVNPMASLARISAAVPGA
jgi:hypothetical protein